MSSTKSSKSTFHHASKEKHKPFKGSKKGKNAKKAKGRLGLKKSSQSNSSTSSQSKVDRKNTAKLIQKNKRNLLTVKNRIFTGPSASPKNVVIVPLSDTVDTVKLISQWRSQSSMTWLTSLHQSSAICYSSKFHGSVHFIPCKMNLLDILKNAMVADFIIFVASANMSSSPSTSSLWSEQCHSALKAQGIPTIIPVLEHTENMSNLMELRKSWLKYFVDHYGSEHLAGDGKLYTSSQVDEIERVICQSQVRGISWRDAHPYAISTEYHMTPDPLRPEHGTLAVSCFIRGRDISVNRLVHLVDIGDFSVEKMAILNYNSRLGKTSSGHVEECSASACTHIDLTESRSIFPEKRDIVLEELKYDGVCESDTISEKKEEKEHSSIKSSQKTTYSRKSKGKNEGLSEYQSAWLLGLDDSSYHSDSSCISSSDADCSSQGASDNEEIDIEEDFEADSSSFEDDMDMIDVEKEKESYRSKKLQDFQDELEFPDEVEAPMDEPAEKRYRKYRGLKSFRHGEWDPNENLPSDYGKVAHFENEKRIAGEAIGEKLNDFYSAPVGQFVRIFLKDVPLKLIPMTTSAVQMPLILFGHLKYEDNFSVVHFTVSRYSQYQEPVEAKEPFLLSLGYRRYRVQPLFSDLSKGPLHKYQRFIKHNALYVASVYAEVQFGQPPALLFKPKSLLPDLVPYDQEPLVLASVGSLLSMNSQRMIIKRITLTGSPFKIHKNSAVIRHMFWNAEDIAFFQTIPLTTKHGRHGHIRMSLGTHGYMKCAFDKSIQQQDIVCLHLYKRIFPKWTTELYMDKNSPRMILDG